MAISDEIKAKLQGAKGAFTAVGKGGKSAADVLKAQSGDAAARLAAEPHPDVIDMRNPPRTGDPEEDAKAEMNALGAGLSGQVASWKEKFATMNDSEFWVGIFFRDNAARNRFLFKTGADQHTYANQYVNGHELARLLGIDIEND